MTYQGTQRELHSGTGVLRYHEAGDGPPLLLLHGSGIGVSGWRNYRANLGVFADRFHCYALEFPGFGISDPVPGNPVTAAVDSVGRLMDALDLESACVIGNSLGAVVASQVAMARPERVRRLVAVGGIGASLLSPDPSEGTRLLRRFADDPTREHLVHWLECMIHDPALLTRELIEERWASAATPAARASIEAMYGSEAIAQRQRAISGARPYWSRLPTLTCPTLLAWGANDRQCPLDMALIAQRLVPRAELHVFPQCGHWVMYEAKEAFERVALEFLCR